MRWSILSGDNNKLHYSLPPKKCIVQGMCVFVYFIKIIITRHSISHGILKVELFFRKKTYTDTAYYLTMPDISNIIIGCSEEEKVVTATIQYAKEKVTKKNTSYFECIHINNSSIRDFKKKIYKSSQKPAAKMILYCTLSFSALLESKTFLTHRNTFYKNASDYFDSYTIIHISQAAEWNRDIYHKTITNVEPNNINVFVLENNIVEISPTKVVRSLIYELRNGGNTLLRMKSVFLVEDNKINKE
jgi:hypothetical protein